MYMYLYVWKAHKLIKFTWYNDISIISHISLYQHKYCVLQLPSGVDMTLAELQEMAARQQQQIEAQQQILVAKEQRLKFLKQQELEHQQVVSENERLRQLREKVEQQELKLKKLRALRGQVDQQKANNNSLCEYFNVYLI